MKKVSNAVIKLLGVLLLTGAALKGWQLLTEPMANNDIWTNRTFLIFTVEFEIALGIWLLSGLFKKAAWLATISCFTLFSFITLYKGLSGAASCGCFGSIHVNPWITLFAIDLPAVLSLSIFRPRDAKLFDWPPVARFAGTAFVGVLVLGITMPLLAFNEPAAVTSTYEILEPSEWVGNELPILEHIDIGEKLKKGNWLVLLYHHGCPDCVRAILMYEQMAQDLVGNEDFLQIALIEVPPYSQGPTDENSPCILGRMDETKEWFVTTPAVALLADSKVKRAWEAKTPDFEAILQNIAQSEENVANSIFVSTNPLSNSLLKGG